MLFPKQAQICVLINLSGKTRYLRTRLIQGVVIGHRPQNHKVKSWGTEHIETNFRSTASCRLNQSAANAFQPSTEQHVTVVSPLMFRWAIIHVGILNMSASRTTSVLEPTYYFILVVLAKLQNFANVLHFMNRFRVCFGLSNFLGGSSVSCSWVNSPRTPGWGSTVVCQEHNTCNKLQVHTFSLQSILHTSVL